MSAATSIATRQALQLDLMIDQADWEGQFDFLEVWRSRSTSGGPYEALTSTGWRPAQIPLEAQSTPPSPAQDGPLLPPIVGKTLSLLVNEQTSYTVTFTGANPLLLGTAATQIQNATDGVVRAYVVGAVLVLQTAQPGSAAVLRISGGDAAPLLGLPVGEPGSVAFGTDARIPLIVGQDQYIFTDVNGSGSYYYKTRFYNSVTGNVSDYSLPFKVSPSRLSPANLVRATLNLMDEQGNPSVGQSILLFSRFAGAQPQGKTVIGGPSNGLTDDTGHFEVLLVRGTKITVAVSGTNLVRDITVPTDPTVQTFDMMDPAYSSDDLFNVKVPVIEYAVRRSL